MKTVLGPKARYEIENEPAIGKLLESQLKIDRTINNSLYFKLLLWDYIRYINIFEINSYRILFTIFHFLFASTFFFSLERDTSNYFMCIDQRPFYGDSKRSKSLVRQDLSAIKVIIDPNNGGANWELSYNKTKSFSLKIMYFFCGIEIKIVICFSEWHFK